MFFVVCALIVKFFSNFLLLVFWLFYWSSQLDPFLLWGFDWRCSIVLMFDGDGRYCVRWWRCTGIASTWRSLWSTRRATAREMEERSEKNDSRRRKRKRYVENKYSGKPVLRSPRNGPVFPLLSPIGDHMVGFSAVGVTIRFDPSKVGYLLCLTLFNRILNCTTSTVRWSWVVMAGVAIPFGTDEHRKKTREGELIFHLGRKGVQ